jgi:hypothetical protein
MSGCADDRSGDAGADGEADLVPGVQQARHAARDPSARHHAEAAMMSTATITITLEELAEMPLEARHAIIRLFEQDHLWQWRAGSQRESRLRIQKDIENASPADWQEYWEWY